MVKAILKLLAPAVIAGALMSSVSTAAPLLGSMAMKNAAEPLTEQVRWRGGWGGGWRGRGWGWGGFAAGAIIGSAIAAPYYRPYPYYAPYGGYYAPYAYPSYAVYPPPAAFYGSGGYGGDPVAYCMSRFRSYDPRSGTYVGLDGRRRPCP